MWFICFIFIYLVESRTILNLSHGIRVINGNDAQEAQFPWQVFIMSLFNNSQTLHTCSGTIINNEWILTSAYCINKADYVSIFSGITNLENTGAVSIGESLIVHEEFENETLLNNIGLVKLENPLVFDDKTKAISLAKDNLEPKIVATVSGWGHSTHDDTFMNLTLILQFADVTVIENTECAKIYGFDIVTSNVVCTKNADLVKGPCENDAGAPLIVISDNDPVHVGIFSFIAENGCDKNYPAGYTRTAAYRTWIRKKTGI